MTKFVTLSFIIIASLLLFSSITYAARPHPVHPNDHPPTAITIQHEDQHIIEEIEEEELGGVEISCEGVGKEECLMMRRTLVAHTDYIYTQKKKKP